LSVCFFLFICVSVCTTDIPHIMSQNIDYQITTEYNNMLFYIM
jgi:hypothetical protein